MVAKLKTSFLKSGFQFFCHRSPFTANQNPNGTNRPGTNQDPDSQAPVARIKSNSQFNSSPDLTLVTNGQSTPTTNTHINLSNRSQPEDLSNGPRSLSASGRVTEKSPAKSSESQAQIQSTSITKIHKKIPKYLAKSKSKLAQNNDDIDPELVIDQKPRSKSSSCLNRESYNNEVDVLATNRIHIDFDSDLDQIRQYNRHSFPSAANNDETNIISDNSQQQVLSNISSTSSSSSDASASAGSDNNKFSGNMITDSACKPNEFFVLNNKEDQHEQEEQQQRIDDHAGNTTNSMKTSLNRSGGNLYKANNQSIAQLKQIKMNQAMNRNNSQVELQNGQDADKNIKAENTQVRKPIKFDGNGAVKQEINSILTKQKKLSKQQYSLNDKNGLKLEKKAVRFADSLGLELESHIHLTQTENPYRRRMVRIHPSHNAPNYFANNLLYQRTPQFAYAVNNNAYQQHIYPNEPLSVSRGVYLPQKPANIQQLNNHTNITHFHNDKILRHQGLEARRFIETKNHFEDPSGNGTCLYDDIINKIAFGGSDSKYQQNGIGSSSNIYVNNKNNNNGNQRRNVEKSSSYEALKRQQNHLRGITYNTNKIGSSSAQQPPQNVTITTRINNGKLESEV